MRNYGEGQVLEKNGAVMGVARHESLEVRGVEDGKVVAVTRAAKSASSQHSRRNALMFMSGSPLNCSPRQVTADGKSARAGPSRLTAS